MIGGFSFEASNQRCFYIVFTHPHLSFQLCVTSVNLPTPFCYRCCFCLENEALGDDSGCGYDILHLSVLIWWASIKIGTVVGDQ